MKKSDLVEVLNAMLSDSINEGGSFMDANEELLSYYLGEPFGDEIEGQSQVVSTDVQDVVEADMPSLARVFLGSGDILVFEPTSASEQDKKEAEDKTAYINWLVRGQPNSFKIIIDWIKEAEIQKCSVVTFYYDEQKAVEEIKYKGLSEDEIAQLKSDIEDDKKVTSVKIDSKESEDGRYNITFKVTRTKGKHVIENVPIENFILS